jgi:hypothetical protein
MLAIDLREADPAARRALALTHSDLDALMNDARSTGKRFELSLVAHTDCLELYSTEADHVAAFRAVLFELVVRAGGRERLRLLPATEVTGALVTQRLLRQAAGLEGRTVFEMLRELNASVTRARAAGTLGPELSALFGSAIETGWRTYTETALGDATKSEAEREVDVPEAERIVEEELVAWKAERRVVSSAPPPALDVSYYSASEPGSAIRLVVPPGLRSARVA